MPEDAPQIRSAFRADDPELSIVVALDDHSQLPAMLAGFANQACEHDRFEILLGNGYPGTDWRDWLQKRLDGTFPTLDVQYVQVDRPSRARSMDRSLRHARAPLVLLFGDDFAPTPRVVPEHLRLHARRPEEFVAGLAMGLFRDGPDVTRFMQWLQESGSLYGVPFRRGAQSIPNDFFYSANTSLKRGFLEEAGGLDTAFRGFTTDDFELGIRLFKQGMEVQFLPDAWAEHVHHITLRARRQAMRQTGRAIRRVESKHPDWSLPRWHRASPWHHRLDALRAKFGHAVTGRRDLREASWESILRMEVSRGYRQVARHSE